MNRIIFYIFLLVLGPMLNYKNIFSEVRQPAVAGQFYSADRSELKNLVERFLATAQGIKIKGKIYGIISPHAGYVYSGAIAGYSYKILKESNFDTVILIGQSHNYYLQKVALYTGDYFRTPLGDISIDKDFIKELLKYQEFFIENKIAHAPEHSLEVQLPFLQLVLKTFKIVPILVSSMDLTKCEKIANIINSLIKKFRNKKVLIVISTDMSHYPSYTDANSVDKETLKSLEKFNPLLFKQKNEQFLSKNIPNLSCTYCGEHAVIIGIYLTEGLGANRVEILKYANSGDVENFGDKSRVVGYCSVVFYKEEIKKVSKEKEFSVTEKNQKVLLQLVRDTIKEYLKNKKMLIFETTDTELLQKSAVFVTLTKNKQLRGCIGTTVAQNSLYRVVQEMALSSAFQDYRFPPVTLDELDSIKIEISVLSPITKVYSADDIKENKHGVIIKCRGRQGLFLPQVWEHFDKKEDFLSELCYQKVGVEADAYKKPDTELCTFTVFAFEEY